MGLRGSHERSARPLVECPVPEAPNRSAGACSDRLIGFVGVKGVWRQERFRATAVTIGARPLEGIGLRGRPCIPPTWMGALALIATV